MRMHWLVMLTIMAISCVWEHPSMAQEGAVGSVGTDIRVNNPATDTGANRTQSETSIAVFGSHLVIGWNDGADPSSNLSAYGFSTDGGASFTDAGAVAGPPGGSTFVQPVVAADHLGNFYFASLAVDAAGNGIVGVATSTDGGVTFAPQVEASVGASNPTDTQSWVRMAIDTSASSPFRGTIYVCWRVSRPDLSTQILLSRSTNGGASFSSAIGISPPEVDVRWCGVATGPSGEVYVAWYEFEVPRMIRLSKSTDGGVTFGAGGVDNTIVAETRLIGRPRFCGRDVNEGVQRVLNGFIGVVDIPSLAVNPTNGHVYLAFNNHPPGADQSDVVFTRSTDGGVSWSALMRVNDDATTNDQWAPALAVQPNGTIGLMWYDRRLDPENMAIDVYVATSTDDGLTFGANQRVTDVSFGVPPLRPNFDTSPNCYMGRYNGITADATQFYLAWGDNRDITAGIPDPNIYFDRLVP